MSDPSTLTSPEGVADFEKFSKHYNETDFWKKLKIFPRSAAGQMLEKALLLRELLIDPGAPLWIRGAVLGALGYLIFPLDLIPDPLPGVGYADDLAFLLLTLAYLDHWVTEDILERARASARDFNSRAPN